MTPSATSQRNRLVIAAVLFLFSGFSALVYQVIWQRILGIFSGVHIYSVTLIVTAFMAGLGLGSLLGGWISDRSSRKTSLALFALCELGIGLFALASPWVYYDFAYLRLGFLIHTPAVLPIVHFGLLLIPTLLMGASLPLLSRAIVADVDGAARTIGILYGLNTFGAALGAALSSWLFIGLVGFEGTIRIGALGNLLAALGAILLVRAASSPRQAVPTRTSVAQPIAPPQTEVRFGLPAWCALYALAGFIALSLELLWFRILDVMIKSSPYMFGHLLFFFLGFLSLGTLYGSVRVGRWRRPDLVGLWCLWGVTAWFGFSLLVLSLVPLGAMGLGLEAYWSTDEGIRMMEVKTAFANLNDPKARIFLLRFLEVYLLQPFFLLAVPTFLMGVAFASIQRSVQTDLAQVGWRVGAIQTSNIVGSIVGSILTGAVFFQFFGTPATATLLICLGSVFVLLTIRAVPGRPVKWVGIGAVMISLGMAFAIPTSSEFWSRFHTPHGPVSPVVEDASGLATIQAMSPEQSYLRVNGKGHSVLPFGDVHTLLGLLPVLMRSDTGNALVIGLGSGDTTWAVGSSPGVNRIDVYEIVAPEAAVIRDWSHNGEPYLPMVKLFSEPRIHMNFSDGRLALRLEDRLYGLIEADGLEPSSPYSGNLYSREFFELAKSKLVPGGLFLTYVPTERTLRTLVSAFPYVLDFHAPQFASLGMGSNEPLTFDPAQIMREFKRPEVQAYLKESGAQRSVHALLARYLRQVKVTSIDPSNRELYLDGDINTDLFPRDEFDKDYRGTYQ